MTTKGKVQKPEPAEQIMDITRINDNLVKEHERLAHSFNKQQDQNEQLACDLEEDTNDAEELANHLHSNEEMIAVLQRKLAEVKKKHC